jgi:Leucine-rich repeat (LRR) protein
MYFYAMKKLLIASILLFSSSQLRAQTTAIPDVYFEQALIDLGLDSILDGFVLTENINIVTTLDVYGKSISDLTGIQHFTALTQLNCSNNQLTSLDVTKHTVLSRLHCSNNQLTSINVAQNTALSRLHCDNNQLTSLDVTQDTVLIRLNCGLNQLTSLDVSHNTALDGLNCYNNQLTSLDVSQNTSLAFLDCSNNQLSCLNIKNGTNTTIVGEKLLASNNPNLICIGVDDVAYSKSNWTLIDTGVSFSTDCSSCLD